MHNIVFYSNSGGFGGHEVMALAAIEALVERPDTQVHAIISDRNAELRTRMASIKGLTVHSFPDLQRNHGHVRAMLALSLQRRLRQLLASLQATAVVTIAPRIESCALPLWSRPRPDLPVIAYLPMAHPPVGRPGRPVRNALQRLMLRHLYGAYDGIITIAEFVRDDIIAQSAQRRIEIVDNFIRVPPQPLASRETLRSAAGLPVTGRLIALAGRVDFHQKGHDWMIRRLADTLADPDTRLVLIGAATSDDVQKLRAISVPLGVDERVLILPWRDNLFDVIAACDLLALPSAFEGVPLVMLEALSLGVPVVGTRRDGMRDLLPSEWLFDRDRPDELRQAVAAALSPEGREKAAHYKSKVRHRFTRARFEAEFAAALERLGALPER